MHSMDLSAYVWTSRTLSVFDWPRLFARCPVSIYIRLHVISAVISSIYASDDSYTMTLIASHSLYL
jgi:hypothetical protein